MDESQRLEKICEVMSRWGVSRVAIGDVTVEMGTKTAEDKPPLPAREYDGVPVTLDDLKRLTLPVRMPGDPD